MGWASEELSRIDLGNRRLNERSVKLLSWLSAKPTASIPAACGGWAETVAAYQFLAQNEIEWTDILQPHADCTMARMRSQAVALCIQDTTELHFNGRGAEGWARCRTKRSRGCICTPRLW